MPSLTKSSCKNLDIRFATADDAADIAGIYNYYIEHTTVTFETEPVSESVMALRIKTIASEFPYLTYMADGKVAGYCYIHKWKERAAYGHTFEVTIYLAPSHCHKGIGTRLLKELIENHLPDDCHVLIASITEGNAASRKLHEAFGFKQASHFTQVGFKFGRWLDVSDYQLLIRP